MPGWHCMESGQKPEMAGRNGKPDRKEGSAGQGQKWPKKRSFPFISPFSGLFLAIFAPVQLGAVFHLVFHLFFSVAGLCRFACHPSPAWSRIYFSWFSLDNVRKRGRNVQKRVSLPDGAVKVEVVGRISQRKFFSIKRTSKVRNFCQALATLDRLECWYGHPWPKTLTSSPLGGSIRLRSDIFIELIIHSGIYCLNVDFIPLATFGRLTNTTNETNCKRKEKSWDWGFP